MVIIMKIEAYTGYNETCHQHLYNKFEIIDKLPALGDNFGTQVKYCPNPAKEIVTDIDEVELDCEQPNDKVYNYKYYEITTDYEEKNEDGEIEKDWFTYLVAVERNDQEEE